MKTGKKYYVFPNAFESIDRVQRDAAELSAAARRFADSGPPAEERGFIAMDVWRRETWRLQQQAAQEYARARDAIAKVREKGLEREFFLSMYLPWRERKQCSDFLH